MVASKEYRVIGKRPLRPDGADKVTGRAQYGADVHLTGMLFGRVKRSPHAHAIVKRIDTSKAEALPGVKAIVTAKDFPMDPASNTTVYEGLTNLRAAQENLLAAGKVLYVGHPVVAVAAIDAHIAEDALDLIEIEYEPLPPVLDVREAMVEGSPVLHDYLRTRDPLSAEPPDAQTNVASHAQMKAGDVEKGFAEADVVIEREYTTTMFHQGYIEPQNGTANWGRDGHLTIWASSQAPWGGRNLLAKLFQISVSDITWMAVEIGGGMNGIFAPYTVPNFVIDGYDVVVNKPKTAAYRAPGTPAGCFAGESCLNELASVLGMDPLDLRIKNASKEGDNRPMGGKWPTIGNVETMLAMKNSPHYKSELSGENRGRGISMGYWGNGGFETSSSASVNVDGTVQLVLGSVDIGGTRASLSQQMAEVLGIDYEDIRAKVVDTDSVGFTGPTGGSRTTFAGGWAVWELGQDIRKQMSSRAAKIWEVEDAQVEYGDDGIIRGPKDAEGKDRSMTFKQLAGQLPRTGGTLDVGTNINKNTPGPSFGGHIIDVEVDKDTGKVTVLRYTAVQDVGTAIHPSYVEGQIQGGVAQGLGMALTEEYYFNKDGAMMNSSFLDYRMPTALDLPLIETVLVEIPNPGHPYGVRGVGETPIVPPLAAAQGAIAEATGLRFNALPITSKVILEELIKDD
jgi:CO/xanthine dehydrogenase Mo-binding subunit